MVAVGRMAETGRRQTSSQEDKRNGKLSKFEVCEMVNKEELIRKVGEFANIPELEYPKNAPKYSVG